MATSTSARPLSMSSENGGNTLHVGRTTAVRSRRLGKTTKVGTKEAGEGGDMPRASPLLTCFQQAAASPLRAAFASGIACKVNWKSQRQGAAQYFALNPQME